MSGGSFRKNLNGTCTGNGSGNNLIPKYRYIYSLSCSMKRSISGSNRVTTCYDRCRKSINKSNLQLMFVKLISEQNIFRTFVKSGGGFFPLQRFDKHHTAFLVIDNRDVLLKSLQLK